MTTNLRKFDTLSGFYAACQREKIRVKTRCGRADDPSPSWQGSDWYGTNTWSEAVELATKGWKAGAARVMKLAEDISAEMVSDVKRPEVVYEVEGDQFDMGRVMADEPESWMTWQGGQEVSQTGTVHIVYNVTASAGVATEILETRGAAVCALVIVLEAAGRHVEVETCLNIDGKNEHRVIVKNAYEPVQIDGLAFALVHPAYFRRFGFAMMGISGSGHGIPRPTAFSQGDVYLAEALYGGEQWKSQEKAQQWVREQLTAQGVKFSRD